MRCANVAGLIGTFFEFSSQLQNMLRDSSRPRRKLPLPHFGDENIMCHRSALPVGQADKECVLLWCERDFPAVTPYTAKTLIDLDIAISAGEPGRGIQNVLPHLIGL